jgi:hypothetical protein
MFINDIINDEQAARHFELQPAFWDETYALDSLIPFREWSVSVALDNIKMYCGM